MHDVVQLIRARFGNDALQSGITGTAQLDAVIEDSAMRPPLTSL